MTCPKLTGTSAWYTIVGHTKHDHYTLCSTIDDIPMLSLLCLTTDGFCLLTLFLTQDLWLLTETHFQIIQILKSASLFWACFTINILSADYIMFLGKKSSVSLLTHKFVFKPGPHLSWNKTILLSCLKLLSSVNTYYECSLIATISSKPKTIEAY